MPVMYETDLDTSMFYTGSVYTPAHCAGVTQGTVSSGFVTGSWYGLVRSWGVDTTAVDVLGSGSAGIVGMGTWHGIAYSYGIEPTVTESSDRSLLTSDENPSPNQGIAMGEWDPFPIPPEPQGPRLPERDTTRYRKTYSSQRAQPRRLRYIK